MAYRAAGSLLMVLLISCANAGQQCERSDLRRLELYVREVRTEMHDLALQISNTKKNLDEFIATDPCFNNVCKNGATCLRHTDRYTCMCHRGFTGKHCDAGLDCSSFSGSMAKNGTDVYPVWFPVSSKVRQVVCDVTTDGGGWMVIQRRFNGSVSFYRNFSEYENGFGDIQGEFWMGLNYVYQLLTACRNNTAELRFDLTDADGITSYRTYANFRLSAPSRYTVHVGTPSGPANRYLGESHGFSYNNGTDFSTHDYGPHSDCVSDDRGGWWYKTCTYVNLNGEYMHPPGTVSGHRSGERGMVYYSFDHNRSLNATEMKVRISRPRFC